MTMTIRTFTVIAICLIIGTSCASDADNSLKADGFGPVRLGAVIKNLPTSSEGLYDRIEPERIEEFDYEGTEYHLVLNGERIATLIENEGKIHAIEILSDKIQTKDGFGLNKTVSQLLAAGAEAYCDNYGFEGLLFRGMLFSYVELTPSGQKKADGAYLDGTDPLFTESDFKPGTHPTQITLAKWYAESTSRR